MSICLDPARMAAATTYPLRERVNYAGIFRHLATVDVLPSVVIPTHDNDQAAPVVVADDRSRLSVVAAHVIVIPTFEISSKQDNVPVADLAAVDRAQGKMAEEIIADEDAVGLMVLDAAASECNGRLAGPLSRDILSDAYAEVERHQLIVASVVLGEWDYKTMVACMGDQLDRIPSGRHARSAATIWGADVIVAPGELKGIYVTTQSQHLAVMPVKQELTVMVTATRQAGFLAFEEVGACVHNPRGVVAIDTGLRQVLSDWDASARKKRNDNLRSVFG